MFPSVFQFNRLLYFNLIKEEVLFLYMHSRSDVPYSIIILFILCIQFSQCCFGKQRKWWAFSERWYDWKWLSFLNISEKLDVLETGERTHICFLSVTGWSVEVENYFHLQEKLNHTWLNPKWCESMLPTSNSKFFRYPARFCKKLNYL